jgi:integrase
MAIFNRVYCPSCRSNNNVYGDVRSINCHSCSTPIKIQEKDYYIEYLDKGKKYREHIGSSKSLAMTVLAKRKVEIAEGRFLEKKDEIRVKFENFADEYYELHCKVNNKKSFNTADKHNIKALKAFFTGLYLDEITVHKVQIFKSERLRSFRKLSDGKIKTLTPTTVNRQLTCLKSIFNKALTWGKFSGENPVKAVKLFKENNGRLRFLEKEEINKLIDNCNPFIRPIVAVAVNTGMRKGEIMGLKWRDIDFKRGIVHLANTKNGEKREIPLNENTINTLISVPKHHESELIFVKDNGQSYGDFKKSFFTACSKSGIKSFRFHDLRHTFASQLVMNGVDLNTVRELLGHKSMVMTLRYSHLSPNFKKQAVETLNNRVDTNTDTNGKLDVDAEFKDIVNSLNSSKLQDNAGLAQLVEQLICNQQVGGSKPLASSI